METEIAATRFRNGEVVTGDSFFSYCRPGQPIPRFISDYTGITNRDVRNAPRPIEVLEHFSKFVGGSVIMAHNGHRFTREARRKHSAEIPPTCCLWKS